MYIKSNKTKVAYLKKSWGGGGAFRSSTENNERDMVVMPIQAEHANWRVFPREAEHSDRLGESTNERLKQLDAE